MKSPAALGFFFLLGLGSCQSTAVPGSAPLPERNSSLRAQLFDSVKSLQGRWVAPMPDGSTALSEIELSGNGSAVVETMFPGTPHQMTNAYHLDGNTLVLTHYCGGGNQPRMRARAVENNTLHFAFDSVTDLAAPDAMYMGEMTLELVSPTRMVQRWKALRSGKLDHEMVFEYTREGFAGTGQPLSEEEMMARTMALATPSEPHRRLQAAAGEWEQQYRMRWDPSADWQETKGTSTARTLLDGRYLMEEIQFELMGMPMKGVHILGYDNRTQEYITLWMDSMSTWWISQRGKEAADGTLELRGTMVDVAGERPFRSVIRHLPDGSVTTEMYDTIAPHGEVQVMSIVAKKRG